MKITIASVSGSPARVMAALELAAWSLVESGWDVRAIQVPALGLPPGIDPEQRELLDRFVLTPGALIESWRVARHLEALTDPGEVVLLSDHRGTGGVFALEQTASPSDRRRRVWTLVGESVAVAHLDTLGTVGGRDGESASAIDWELTQYRFSDAVLTVALRGVELLSQLGVAATPIPVPFVDIAETHDGGQSVIWLPEAASRRSRTPMIMRSLEETLRRDPKRSLVINTDDEEDEIWSGTTWMNIAPSAVEFGERITRGVDDQVGAIILGDSFAVPSAAVVAAYSSGRTIFVRSGSAAAALMPEAVTWTDEDDLAAAIARGPRVEAWTERLADAWPEPHRSATIDRSRAVSVGIPVYRDVRFLDECMRSVLDQSQRPHEVLIFDDGSASADVDAALARWHEREPDLVRVMSGPNRGVCVARNEMLDAMTGDAFVLVDSDDVLHSEFIEACSTVLRSRPGLTAVATWTDFFGGYNGVEAKPPFDVRVGLRENPIISTAVLVDMSARDDGVRFEPDLAFLYCEDWQVWSQIIAGGGAFGLVPRALVRHRVHPSSGATRRTPLAHTVGQARATQPMRPGQLP